MKFIVIVTNDILGASRHEMTLDQIKDFNLCAYRLAVKSSKNGGREYSDGMWTVRGADNHDPPAWLTLSFLSSP